MKTKLLSALWKQRYINSLVPTRNTASTSENNNTQDKHGYGSWFPPQLRHKSWRLKVITAFIRSIIGEDLKGHVAVERRCLLDMILRKKYLWFPGIFKDISILIGIYHNYRKKEKNIIFVKGKWRTVSDCLIMNHPWITSHHKYLDIYWKIL